MWVQRRSPHDQDNATGDREILDVEVGDSEDGAFWTAFLRSLRARGLSGVQLVISDHHLGLKAAIASVFIGASWQRSRVHFMSNVLARVPKASSEMVAAAIRTIFAQPDTTHVNAQADEITCMLTAKFPDVATMLGDAREDLLAFAAFPVVHWKLRSGARTRWSGSTGRSNAAPESSGQRRRRFAPHHRRDRQHPRRMATRRTALPLRRINGEAQHHRAD